MTRNRDGAQAVVLFDGVCNFCNASINFAIDRDPAGRLKFAALQSPAGQDLLRRHGLPTRDFDTVVVVEDGRVFKKSDAALRIAGKLSGAWPWLRAFAVVPKFVRDFAYDVVAANRYRIFGSSDACRVPTPDLRRRFLT
jgi:predicted DCC family thiol-disulfide oxidoreductase YuxK